MLTPMGLGLRRVQKAATPFTLTPFYRDKVGEGRENGLHYARAIILCGFVGCCIVVLGGRGIRFLDCWRQPKKHPKRGCTALWGICDFLSSLTYIGLGCSHLLIWGPPPCIVADVPSIRNLDRMMSPARGGGGRIKTQSSFGDSFTHRSQNMPMLPRPTLRAVSVIVDGA